MHLDPNLARYILKAFAKSLALRHHNVDINVFLLLLLFVVVVLGLFPTMSIVVFGLKSA